MTPSQNTALRPATPPATRAVSSQQLLQGGNELVIVHAGQSYTLRLTRQGKLILTK